MDCATRSVSDSIGAYGTAILSLGTLELFRFRSSPRRPWRPAERFQIRQGGLFQFVVGSNRRRTSSSLNPSIQIALSRDLAVLQHNLCSEIFNSSARNLRSAAFAFPSSAGARSLILIPAPCSPLT